MRNALAKKIGEESKDRRLLDFLQAVSPMMEAHFPHAVSIGSCAVFAWLGQLPRLTRDLDLLVRSDRCGEVREALRIKGWTVRGARGFLRVVAGKFQIHIVNEDFELFDLVSTQRIGTVNLGVLLEGCTRKRLEFPSLGESVELGVPDRTLLFLTGLLAPLNTNTVQDSRSLLELGKLDLERIERFLAGNGHVAELFRARIEGLSRLLDERTDLVKDLSESMVLLKGLGEGE